MEEREIDTFKSYVFGWVGGKSLFHLTAFESIMEGSQGGDLEAGARVEACVCQLRKLFFVHCCTISYLNKEVTESSIWLICNKLSIIL